MILKMVGRKLEKLASNSLSTQLMCPIRVLNGICVYGFKYIYIYILKKLHLR